MVTMRREVVLLRGVAKRGEDVSEATLARHDTNQGGPIGQPPLLLVLDVPVFPIPKPQGNTTSGEGFKPASPRTDVLHDVGSHPAIAPAKGSSIADF